MSEKTRKAIYIYILIIINTTAERQHIRALSALFFVFPLPRQDAIGALSPHEVKARDSVRTSFGIHVRKETRKAIYNFISNHHQHTTKATVPVHSVLFFCFSVATTGRTWSSESA